MVEESLDEYPLYLLEGERQVVEKPMWVKFLCSQAERQDLQDDLRPFEVRVIYRWVGAFGEVEPGQIQGIVLTRMFKSILGGVVFIPMDLMPYHS